MKVLKRPNTSWTMKHTCSQCTAQLEVEKGDLKFSSYPGDYRDPGYETWTATCPICAVPFNITASSIPKVVQLEVKRGLASPGTSYPFDK
jgi:hypothetical protein